MSLTSSTNANTKYMFSRIGNSNSNSVPLLNQEISLRKSWIEYGVGDKMPTRLLELYNQSGFHHAIIDSKVNMIAGDGIEQDIESNDEYSERTQSFITNPNPYESLDTLNKKLAYDYEIFGLAYIEIIYSNDRKSIAEINHIDASKIRMGKKSKGHLTHVYYSENWLKPTKYKPVAIPTFNATIKDDYPRQILPIIRYSPSIDYYTLPSYYAEIKWIEIDYQISNFHENNIKNGFAPTIYFGFPMGTPTEEEMAKIEDKLKSKYGGTNNAGGIITAFYEAGAENEVKIEVLSISDADKQYEWLLKATQQQILIGHKVTNENLMGISTASKLGSSNELIQANELYYNNVIKHEQNDILEGLNKIFTYNGMNNILIQKTTILGKELSENVMATILTKNELRDVIGYEPIETQVVSGTTATTLTKLCDCGHVHADVHAKEFNLEGIKLDLSALKKGDKFKFSGKEYKFAGEYINADNPITKDMKDSDVFIWTLSGKSDKEKCPICLGHAGKIRTLGQWKKIAIPATKASTFGGTYQYGDYGSYCEENCNCRLNKVEVINDPTDTF